MSRRNSALEAQEFNRLAEATPSAWTCASRRQRMSIWNSHQNAALSCRSLSPERLSALPADAGRERRDDIPLLARHFAKKYGLRHRKPVTCITTARYSRPCPHTTGRPTSGNRASYGTRGTAVEGLSGTIDETGWSGSEL